MSDEPMKPIKAPESNPAANFGRRVVKAVGGAVPMVGSAISEYFDASLPNPDADQRLRWEGDVTDSVNSLHTKVGGIEEAISSTSATIDGATAAVAKYLIESCRDGLGLQYIDRDFIVENLAVYGKDEIADALSDLEAYGLITAFTTSSSKHYRLTPAAYRNFDKQIMGWDTISDAKAVASIALQTRHGVFAVNLEQELGWSRRRLNPALRFVVDFIAPGRVSQEMQADYVTKQFYMDDAERSQLRRFVASR
jgi:hypothetical protein